MSESEGFVRMTITVPAGLRKEMDGEKESVNWSATAAEAFRAKLLELASKREARTMDEVITRLKASKQKHADESFKAGKAAGERWAKRGAEAHQLKRLAEIDKLNFSEQSQVNELLAIVLDLDDWADIGYRSDDLEAAGLGDSEQKNEAYLDGFEEGAVEVWRAVEDQLD